MTLPQPSNPNWEEIKKACNAETEALEAQKKLLDIRKALKDAETPSDPAVKAQADRLAQIKADKEKADAEKANADARKAEAEASLAAFKAQVGEVPSSGYTGNVTLKDRAGVAEATLLAAKALKTAAQKIVESTSTLVSNKTVLLYSTAEIPSFQAYIVFNAQVDLAEIVFKEAQKISDDANTTAPKPEGIREAVFPIAGAIGLSLDAINKLIGFFRTDYTVGGVEITFEDSILIHALAERFIKTDKTLKILLPAVYTPGALTGGTSVILKRINLISKTRQSAPAKIGEHTRISETYTAMAEKEKKQEEKDSILKKAKMHKDAAEAWKTAAEKFDSFINKITTVDEKGAAPLTSVIKESVIAESLLSGNPLLIVKLQKSGGAYYTKNNMLTFFGRMPFYHMGGVVASFVLLDGPAGNVLAAGVVPVHGGFVKADKLANELQKDK